MADIRTKQRYRIGQQFKAKREEQGWTTAQVAVMADVKERTIEKIENGVFNIPIDVLAKVADVLGCDLVIKERKEI